MNLGPRSHVQTLARLHAAPRRGSLRQWGALVAAVLVGLVIAVAGYDRPQRVDSNPEGVSVALPPGVATESSAAGVATANGSSAEAAAATGATGAVVHVVGSVHQPGLMALPVGARVSDALAAAGGALPGTDLSSLNLARRLNDGEQIVVGASAVEAMQQSSTAAANNAASGAGGNSLVNLNQADSEDLQDLPRVGPATAEKILRYRQENGPFTSIDQLLEVPGIGEATLAGLRDLVAV